MNREGLIAAYQHYCEEENIPFNRIESVRSYDTTTLFCPAGMQQFKAQFADPEFYGVLANLQSCLRLDDALEIGDGTHLLHFDMLGLFAFRTMSVEEAIDFWRTFLASIGITPTHFTIHPDKFEEWRSFYGPADEVRPDPDCQWSDGKIGGYSTEFYVGELEIGNIVNPNGDCIDVGFGLGRLLSALGQPIDRDEITILVDAITAILATGVKPGPKGQGYVLRRLLRRLWLRDPHALDHPYLSEEGVRQHDLSVKFAKLWPKNKDKPPAWWFDTHGINLSDHRSEP